MSDEEKENCSGKEHTSDDKLIGSLEVGVDSNDIVQVFKNSSKITNDKLEQCVSEDTEVSTSDVIAVQQISHESLAKFDGERSECKVIYEFPSDYESEYDSHLSQFVNDYQSPENPELHDHIENPPILPANKAKDKPIQVVDTKTLNKDTPDVVCNAGIWKEVDRKRKKNSVPLLQNKRHKEIQVSCNPAIELSSDQCDEFDDFGYVSGELADTEDNVKDSSSSDSSDSNSANETEMRFKNLASDIPKATGVKREPSNENKSVKVNQNATPESSSSQTKSIEENADKSLFLSSLKGETLPVFKLSEESKKRFEMCMPTIFEVKESQSSEQISQPSHSKAKPLKMKAKVVKRKDKCNVCSVRLGLCAIQCRCGGYYCAKHRYDKEHNCTFDYKSMGAAEIRKNNPRVTAEKIRKL